MEEPGEAACVRMAISQVKSLTYLELAAIDCSRLDPDIRWFL